MVICDVLRDLVQFLQFKKREKHPRRVATLLKVSLLHGCFSHFSNCADCTKSCKESRISKIIFPSILYVLKIPDVYPDIFLETCVGKYLLKFNNKDIGATHIDVQMLRLWNC